MHVETRSKDQRRQAEVEKEVIIEFYQVLHRLPLFHLHEIRDANTYHHNNTCLMTECYLVVLFRLRHK